MPESLKIVIVGGGTAGWMTAAALCGVTTNQVCHVTLIESDQIGSVGVGEATLPHIKNFNDYIGLNEADMMQKTNATFKLGIEFINWGKIGKSYIHPFGKFGEALNGADFHQHWAHQTKQDKTIPAIETYSFAVEMCRQNRFDFPLSDQSEIASTFTYAYHFDASLYAAYLRSFSETKGLVRREGKIASVNRNIDTGYIDSLTLESGEEIHGDYFIDCSGFRSLLLGETLGAKYEDWSDWLPCNRAVAVQSGRSLDFSPYTRSIAKHAGWQWRIPLQHRTGNGYVYCNSFISDENARESLLNDLDSNPLIEPRFLKFNAGRYKDSWQKNCIAIGLASGFLEPLESTSIYLIQIAVLNFLKFLPDKKPHSCLIDEYNRLMDIEYERIRDFLILHYHLNERNDSELWRHCRAMSIPDSLQQKIDMFSHRGYLDNYKFGLFSVNSWLSVLIGQGLQQKNVDPYVNNVPYGMAHERLEKLASSIKQKVQALTTHTDFIADYCPAKYNMGDMNG